MYLQHADLFQVFETVGVFSHNHSHKLSLNAVSHEDSPITNARFSAALVLRQVNK